MQRYKGLMIVLMILVWAVAAPVSASQLSFVATHDFSTSLIHVETNEPIPLRQGQIEANLYGNARYNPEELAISFPSPTNISYGTPATLSVELPSMTWLKTTKAAISYDGDAGYTLSHNYIGYGPSPAGPMQPGYLEQWQLYPFHFCFYVSYLAPEDGTYRAELHDIYDLAFSLVQGLGSVYPFSQVRGWSYIYLDFLGPQSYGNTFGKVIDLEEAAWPALPDFTVWREHQEINLSLTLDNIKANDELRLVGGIYAGQIGYTLVPVPSSLLLVGPGLWWFWARRRR